MFGLGTIINAIAIIIGGLLGLLFKKAIPKCLENSIMLSTGLAVIVIGLNGIISSFNNISNPTILIIISLILGTILGELINIEDQFTNLGKFLQTKFSTKNDPQFVKAFLLTSFTVAIGAMAVLGSINDGISGDYTILLAKSFLDFIIVLIMTTSLGKGCLFSCVPVFILEGLMTIAAHLLGNFLTITAIANISLIGSILIMVVGINLTFDKKIKVANMLPSLIIAIILAYIIK